VLGPLDGPLIDLSGGQWRRWAFAREEDWPPADASLERRKYLAFANGETWLLKFAGLGREGERKLALARRLHRAGLTPGPLGLVHGFLVERWHGNAARLGPEEAPVAAIGRYIGVRARESQGEACAGASIHELFDMTVQNFAEAGVASPIEDWAARLDGLEAAVRRYPTDNAMAPHEWLRLLSRELIKSDALDHHRGHDLVGCQDIAWDVAGVIVEFALNDGQASRLRCIAERESGLPVDADLLGFYRLAYAAFRLGQLKFALDRSYDDAEIVRNRAAVRAIRRALETESEPAG
jgi:hypothetical protein